MNKKLIAIAVAASFAAPMAAQAEPTVYGNLQVEVADIDDGGTKQADADTGAAGSSYMGTDDNKRGRLGLKGSEDLGGGMSAIYNFEWQVETTQGQVNDGTRVGMVGIKAGFGTIMAGSLKTPYKYYGGVKYDPFVTTYLEARSRGGMSGKAADAGFSTKGSFGHHGFMTDAIGYKGKFGAVEVWANTSLDEKGGAKGADGDINAGVKFSGGNFEAFVAMASNDSVTQGGYDAQDDGTANDAIAGDYSATKFGGMFKMGPHKIKAQIESTEATITRVDVGDTGTFATVTGTSGTWESDFIFLGYEMAMGKNVIVVNYGTRESTSGAYTEDQDYLAVGVIHKLSKKTRAFVGYSTSETSDNEVGSKAVDASVTSLGLRVDF